MTLSLHPIGPQTKVSLAVLILRVDRELFRLGRRVRKHFDEELDVPVLAGIMDIHGRARWMKSN